MNLSWRLSQARAPASPSCHGVRAHSARRPCTSDVLLDYNAMSTLSKFRHARCCSADHVPRRSWSASRPRSHTLLFCGGKGSSRAGSRHSATALAGPGTATLCSSSVPRLSKYAAPVPRRFSMRTVAPSDLVRSERCFGVAVSRDSDQRKPPPAPPPPPPASHPTLKICPVPSWAWHSNSTPGPACRRTWRATQDLHDAI